MITSMWKARSGNVSDPRQPAQRECVIDRYTRPLTVSFDLRELKLLDDRSSSFIT